MRFIGDVVVGGQPAARPRLPAGRERQSE
ncbi:hypothetical protein RB2654_14935 [Rhodobacterales bacterium HTCC2654]|uniref:Uncharacterized protein n=1 Tax=Maritimibacter alkaliphilus HTCC2654 TaxID=314271 RepID=A3VH36_9RHOB|nr:hypothetical protein RB2654_14935 [Rhodobacterales bacterium HTCC2654] [Maritimibacter alkaliphilus HTCC2654]